MNTRPFAEFVAEDARLVILRLLSNETSGTSNEVMLQSGLQLFGHNRSREFVRTQLRKLEELGAVELREQGTVLVPTITRLGTDHVERRTVIDGVARPSPGN